MFAIAAFAIGGMMVTPAFATGYTNSITQYNPQEGVVTNSGWQNHDCNIAGSECNSRQKIYNEWPYKSDAVTIAVDVQNVSCEIDFEWYQNGTLERTWSYPGSYSGYGFGVTKHFEIEDTDTIKTRAIFTNCS